MTSISDDELALRWRFVLFFRHHDPDKAGNVGTILARAKGKEEGLMEVLIKRYGPEPPFSFPTEEDFIPLRERLTRYYEVHDPSRVSTVDTLSRKYLGVESILFDALEQKYGPETRTDVAPDTDQHIEENASGQMDAEERLAQRIRRFYTVYDQSKLDDVDKLCQKYVGNEGPLFAALEQKYGPEPVTDIQKEKSLPSSLPAPVVADSTTLPVEDHSEPADNKDECESTNDVEAPRVQLDGQISDQTVSSNNESSPHDINEHASGAAERTETEDINEGVTEAEHTLEQGAGSHHPPETQVVTPSFAQAPMNYEEEEEEVWHDEEAEIGDHDDDRQELPDTSMAAAHAVVEGMARHHYTDDPHTTGGEQDEAKVALERARNEQIRQHERQQHLPAVEKEQQMLDEQSSSKIRDTIPRPVDVPDAQPFKSRLFSFFCHYDPTRIPEIDSLVESNSNDTVGDVDAAASSKGKEEEFINFLTAKYGPEPETNDMDSARMSQVNALRQRLAQFYTDRGLATKLQNVPVLAVQFSGKEELLFSWLHRKYDQDKLRFTRRTGQTSPQPPSADSVNPYLSLTPLEKKLRLERAIARTQVFRYVKLVITHDSGATDEYIRIANNVINLVSSEGDNASTGRQRHHKDTYIVCLDTLVKQYGPEPVTAATLPGAIKIPSSQRVQQERENIRMLELYFQSIGDLTGQSAAFILHNYDFHCCVSDFMAALDYEFSSEQHTDGESGSRDQSLGAISSASSPTASKDIHCISSQAKRDALTRKRIVALYAKYSPDQKKNLDSVLKKQYKGNEARLLRELQLMGWNLTPEEDGEIIASIESSIGGDDDDKRGDDSQLVAQQEEMELETNESEKAAMASRILHQRNRISYYALESAKFDMMREEGTERRDVDFLEYEARTELLSLFRAESEGVEMLLAVAKEMKGFDDLTCTQLAIRSDGSLKVTGLYC